MTISQALKLNTAVESDLLLSHVLNHPKEFLFLHPNNKLTANQEQQFRKLIRRRQRGEPLAYIVGYKYFCGYKFTVNKKVLIPRPETEWLVEHATKIIKKKLAKQRVPKTLKVLDIGTGSGCIAISLVNNLGHDARVQITGSDVSAAALTVARHNARQHTAKINFVRSNLFQNLNGKYDVIVANLPYVTIRDYRKLKRALRYEPALALHDKTNSFVLYQRFLKQLPEHVTANTIVLMETDPGAKKLLSLPQPHRWYKDLQGLWRYVALAKNPRP